MAIALALENFIYQTAKVIIVKPIGEIGGERDKGGTRGAKVARKGMTKTRKI